MADIVLKVIDNKVTVEVAGADALVPLAIAAAAEAAAEAAGYANDAASSAQNAEDSYQEILDFASGSPTAPSILNKLNRDGDNADSAITENLPYVATGTGGSSRSVFAKLFDIVTAADFSTIQQAAAAAINKVFFFNAPVTVDCSDGNVQAAWDKCRFWQSGRLGVAKVTIPAGTFSIGSTVQLYNSGSAQIAIEGVAPTPLVFVSLVSISNGVGNHSVVYELDTASAAQVSVGDVLYTTATVGTGAHRRLRGAHLVTGKSGNQVTVLNPGQFNVWPARTVTSMTLRKAQTYLEITGLTGFLARGINGDGSAEGVTFKNIVLVSKTAGATGVFVEDASKVSLGENFTLIGFESRGIRTVSGANVKANDNFITGCGEGMNSSSNSFIQSVRTIISGCTSTAMSATSGIISARFSEAYGCQRGISNDGGNIIAPDCIHEGHTTGGHRNFAGRSYLSTSQFFDNGIYNHLTAFNGYTDLLNSVATGATVDIRSEFGGSLTQCSGVVTTTATASAASVAAGGAAYAAPTFDPPLDAMGNGASKNVSTGVTQDGNVWESISYQFGSVKTVGRRTASTVFNFPSIAAGASSSTTLTFTGADAGVVLNNAKHFISAYTISAPIDGVHYRWILTANNVCTLTLINYTGSAIDPGNSTYAVIVDEIA